MTEIEKDIIELVKEGYSFNEISKILQKEYSHKILETKKKLMEKGLLTEDDIAKGKKERKRKRLKANPLVQKIYRCKMQGMSDNAISRMPNIKISQSQVSQYVREGIELGLIQKEKIEKAQEERKEEEKNNDSDRKRVLEGLKRGEIDTVIAKDTTVGYRAS